MPGNQPSWVSTQKKDLLSDFTTASCCPVVKRSFREAIMIPRSVHQKLTCIPVTKTTGKPGMEADACHPSCSVKGISKRITN
jgi:hypothetical protein